MASKFCHMLVLGRYLRSSREVAAHGPKVYLTGAGVELGHECPVYASRVDGGRVSVTIKPEACQR